MKNDFPIYTIKDKFINALSESNRFIVTASTGSGKSTILPLFVQEHGLQGKKIVVIQPRRLAAIMLSRFVCEQHGFQLGKEIGYITRYEREVSDETTIMYITDGILLKFLQHDPLLADIDAVIFDEFHERTVANDMGLALIVLLQQQRPDLKLILMSATLNTEALTHYLGPQTQCFHAEGKLFPVHIKYLSMPLQRKIWEKAADLAKDFILKSDEGNILIFMPGQWEINKTIECCQQHIHDPSIQILPLYSDLSSDDQKKVMQHNPDIRKIIVATTIAETSLTIPNIRLVIDSGLVKVGRYNPLQEINSLITERNSIFSADQRSGRAGRVGPGLCYRLWTKDEHALKPKENEPEILRTDLSDIVLFLASLGYSDFNQFPWFQSPLLSSLSLAEKKLIQLKALDETQKITPKGLKLAAFSLPPHLAAFILEAISENLFYPAALLTAIYMEPNAFENLKKITSLQSVDCLYHSDVLKLILHFYENKEITAETLRKKGMNASLALKISRTISIIKKQCGSKLSVSPIDQTKFMCLLIKGFYNHLSAQRSPQEYELANGRRGRIHESTLFKAPLLLAMEMKESGDIQNATLRFSVLNEIKKEWLIDYFSDYYSKTEEVFWDETSDGFIKRIRERYFGVLIHEKTEIPEKNQELIDLFVERIKNGKLQLPNWDEKTDQWIFRTRLLSRLFPDKKLIAYDEDDMDLIYSEMCEGITKAKQLKSVDCFQYVRGVLSWHEQEFVEKEAPARIKLPGGHYLKLTYDPSTNVVKGRARISDIYDLDELPIIAGGKIKILLDILAPNWRTVQLTDDLPRFWQEHYPKLKKELSRKYPKHKWR